MKTYKIYGIHAVRLANRDNLLLWQEPYGKQPGKQITADEAKAVLGEHPELVYINVTPNLWWCGWKTISAPPGYNVDDYFGAEGYYIGPDAWGIEPTWVNSLKEADKRRNLLGLLCEMKPGDLTVSNDWPKIVHIPPCDGKDPFVVCTVESCDHGISGQFHFEEEVAKSNAWTIAAIPDLILELRETLECLRCNFNKTDGGPRPSVGRIPGVRPLRPARRAHAGVQFRQRPTRLGSDPNFRRQFDRERRIGAP